MKDKWDKRDAASIRSEGQPVGHGFSFFSETYRPKLSHAPSQRAINNYNSIKTTRVVPRANGDAGGDVDADDDDRQYDNLTFLGEDTGTYEVMSAGAVRPQGVATRYPRSSDGSERIYDSPVLPSRHAGGGINGAATHSIGGDTATSFSSENDRRDELGSTTKLVEKRKPMICLNCLPQLKSILAIVSLGAGIGNVVRLPVSVMLWGGIPFLVAYVALLLFVGLPLLFLELGFGQLAQEGVTKTWRAVPLFRGVGYVKLLACSLLSIYYPLYMALTLYYIIWTAEKTPPFSECAVVKISETGYKADGVLGQQCLKKTFLESPFTNPSWFGVYAALLFLVWTIIMLLSFRRTKSFMKSLAILLFPTLACMIALIAKSATMESIAGFDKLFKGIQWEDLNSAYVWYYAAIQVFFSTQIGFGNFVTSAGIMHNKLNPFWTATGYILVNLVIGLVAVLLTYFLSFELSVMPKGNSITELQLMTLIYDSALQFNGKEAAKVWSIVAFALILLSGFISMTSLVYTILKAVSVETKRRWRWWHVTAALCLVGCCAGAAFLLCSDFQIVHLLDHYVIGNLVLITVILEVFAFVVFYGTKRMRSDFEFIMGSSLSPIWLVLWWAAPIILSIIFGAALATTRLNGLLREDPLWLWTTGWGIVVGGAFIIVLFALYQIYNQDEYYTFTDRLASTVKPNRKWGPVDTIMRYTWVQWHSKAKDGERDFTLKRRGTRDYTHSVKKRNKSEPYSMRYVSTLSDTSTMERGTPTYAKKDMNKNDIRHSHESNHYDTPIHITSLVDAMDSSSTLGKRSVITSSYPDYTFGKGNMNPLALAGMYGEGTEGTQESSTSEGYGTYRKGPYIIDDEVLKDHVCFRRMDSHEYATEL